MAGCGRGRVIAHPALAGFCSPQLKLTTPPGQITEGLFEHLAGLERAGAGRGLTGTQIPHAPGRTVEDRFCEDGA